MDVPVLIVGGGTSGLSLALALLRNGVPVRIIEKDTRVGVGQRGCGIQPRTLEIYKILGILPDIVKLARLAPTVHLYSSPGGSVPLKALDLNEIMEATPQYPYINPLILGQDRHEDILRSHLKNDYGCTVELGTQLKSFEESPNYVTAVLVKVKDGEEISEAATFSWLIGADGAHSSVRKLLGLQFTGVTRESEVMVVGDVHIRSGLGDKKSWPFWGNDFTKKFVALRPFETEDNNQYNFMVGGADLDHEIIASSREELIKAVHEITGRKDIQFGDVVWMGTWRPNIRMVEKFGEGRVWIVGDAAHVLTPGGGQGMNAGIQDSVNLAWKIAHVKKGLSPASILETYTQERRPVISTILDSSTEIFDASIQHGSSGRGLVRGFELRQLGINYRGSPLVFDDRSPKDNVIENDPYRAGNDGTTRGGDRAPDAQGLFSVTDSTITCLFDLFRPELHTVLIFSNSTDDQHDILKTLNSYPNGAIQTAVIQPSTSTSIGYTELFAEAPVFIDREGVAFKNYNITGEETTVVIVRPDGHIGALIMKTGIEGVTSYFKGIYV